MTRERDDYSNLLNAVRGTIGYGGIHKQDPYGFAKAAGELIQTTDTPQQTADAIYTGLSKFSPSGKLIATIETYHESRGTGDLPIRLEQDLKDTLDKISDPMTKLNTTSFIYSSIRDTDTLKDYMSNRVIEAFERVTALSDNPDFDRLDFAYKTFASNTTHASLKNYMRRVVIDEVSSMENIQEQTRESSHFYQTCHGDKEIRSDMLAILHKNMARPDIESLLDEETFEDVTSLLAEIAEENSPQPDKPDFLRVSRELYLDELDRM